MIAAQPNKNPQTLSLQTSKVLADMLPVGFRADHLQWQ
jgi:hypothetical protein